MGLINVCGSVFGMEDDREGGSVGDLVGVVAGVDVGGVGIGLVVAVCEETRLG